MCFVTTTTAMSSAKDYCPYLTEEWTHKDLRLRHGIICVFVAFLF